MAPCLICYFILILSYIEEKWFLIRNLITIWKISAFWCYGWRYQIAEKWLNFQKVQLKSRIVKHFTRVKQGITLKKLFSHSTTPPHNQINLTTPLEQKFSYVNIQKYTNICFQGASRIQFLGVQKWCSTNAFSDTKQKNVGWKICKVRKVFGCVAKHNIFNFKWVEFHEMSEVYEQNFVVKWENLLASFCWLPDFQLGN